MGVDLGGGRIVKKNRQPPRVAGPAPASCGRKGTEQAPQACARAVVAAQAGYQLSGSGSQPAVLSTQSSALAAGRTGSETIVAPVRRGVPGSPPTRIAAAGLARPAGVLSEDGAARACPRRAIRQRLHRRAVRAAGGGGVLTRPTPGNWTRRKAPGAGNQGLRR